jgi:2-hydroxy-3-keto-5-methylthiopentenyl-1-phosphate phosphatase
MLQKTILLSDFDGTVVNMDTGAFVLTKFAKGDWKLLEKQLESGEITFEECLRKQFAMLNTPRDRIIEAVDEAASLRPHFAQLVNRCEEYGIRFIIVSGGLDFCINHLLKKNNITMEVVAPKSNYAGTGIELQFPSVHDKSSFSFKDDLVKHYRRLGFAVIFVGDGYADYFALKEANLRFAVKGSLSAQMCRANGIACQEISDLTPVLSLVENEGTSRSPL